jgi:hypothetical protein
MVVQSLLFGAAGPYLTGDGDPEAIRQAIADARKAGYSFEAITRIGQTLSDVYLFSRLPESRSGGHSAPGERPGVRAVHHARQDENQGTDAG